MADNAEIEAASLALDKDKFILEAAKRFIRGYEQVPETQDFAPQAYQPIAGDRWTIGWGSTRGVKEGDTVTREQAESRFDRDLQSAFSDFNSTVSEEIRDELGINESAAVISFLFNHGNTKRWRGSKARGHLNKLEIPQFIYELTDPVQGFVKAGEPGEKEIVDGLVNRRAAERKLFNAPDVDIGAGIGALSVNGLNQGGIASFRPMGAVPTGVGMPMHMPRPPRGQMPPQGMRRGGIVGYQNRGQVEGPLPPHLQMRPSWTPGEDEGDIEEVIIDREDWHVTYRALVEELERFQQLANSTGYTVEEIIENRRGQGSLDPTAAAQMFEMLEEQREAERNRELGERLGPMFGPQAGAGKAGSGPGGMMDPEGVIAPYDPDTGRYTIENIPYKNEVGSEAWKAERARERAEAAALYDRRLGFQGGGVVTPFGMSLADTAEMASFSSQAQTASNGDLRGGIMSGQEAPGSGALGALSRQEFGTGRSLLPSFTTEERGMPGVEAQESWEVQPNAWQWGYNRGGLTGQANKVAGAGRYGDTELVHMNPAEVQGLASMVPMTINPETGKPEAFLGMLMALLGQYVAPMIAASSWGSGLAASGGLSGLLGTALSSPTALGALGSTAGTWAQTGDLEKGILSGMMSFGTGKLLNDVALAGDEFITSGATGQGALAGTTVADPLAAATAASTATALPAIPARPGVGPFGFGARAGQAATSGLPATATPAMRDAVFKKIQAETMKANQGIFNQQSLGTRLGHAGKNLATKEGISALMNPTSIAMIASGAGGLGAIRSEEEFAAWFEQQEEEKKRRRAKMMSRREQIPQGVRQRFGLPAYGGG